MTRLSLRLSVEVLLSFFFFFFFFLNLKKKQHTHISEIFYFLRNHRSSHSEVSISTCVNCAFLCLYNVFKNNGFAQPGQNPKKNPEKKTFATTLFFFLFFFLQVFTINLKKKKKKKTCCSFFLPQKKISFYSFGLLTYLNI